eukprot:4076603-Amphidinium_carterae.1
MVSLDMSRHTLLGVDADFSNGKTLFIKSIIPGAVEVLAHSYLSVLRYPAHVWISAMQEWNKGCQSGRAVEAGCASEILGQA